jgi:hypothetical protein
MCGKPARRQHLLAAAAHASYVEAIGIAPALFRLI